MNSSTSTPSTTTEGPASEQDARRRRSARLKLLAILAVCASPVIAGTLAYYVFPPQGRTNYGDLVEPQRPVAGLEVAAVAVEPVVPAAGAATTAPADWQALRGKWVMVVFDDAACDRRCAEKLYLTRQVRLTTGRERDRIERVLVVLGPGPARFVDAQAGAGMRDVHEDLRAVRADAAQAAALFSPAPGGDLRDHVYLVDPLGHLMMRFPKDPDPAKMKKDLGKLLKWSRIG